MKTNLYGFLIALLMNATIAIAYPGKIPFTAPNSSSSSTTPKAFIAGFQCSSTDKQSQLTWSVKNNEMADQLVLEKSIGGKDFKAVAVIFTTDEAGTIEYAYRDKEQAAAAVYRIKILQKTGKTEYSTIVSR